MLLIAGYNNDDYTIQLYDSGSTSVKDLLNFNLTDVSLLNGQYLYFGAPTTDGTWRVSVSGANLIFERRITGSYTTKWTVLG